MSILVRDTNQTVLDLGKKGSSNGDLYTFHGPVFDRKNGKQIGRYGGTCTTLASSSAVPADLACSANFILPKGQLLIQGIGTTARLYSGKTFGFAIVGGTGAYAAARGDGSIRVPTDIANHTDGYVVLTIR